MTDREMEMHDSLDNAIRGAIAVRAEIERLRDCLHECAEDLAAELDARHSSRDHYATIHNAYERDMAPVYRARELLAALQGSAKASR